MLLAERASIGQEWFAFLVAQKAPFIGATLSRSRETCAGLGRRFRPIPPCPPNRQQPDLISGVEVGTECGSFLRNSPDTSKDFVQSWYWTRPTAAS